MTDDTSVRTGNERAAPIPIVAIGASAGGLKQIKLLLQHMPADTGAAFVVLQHLDPDRKSHLAALLTQSSVLPAVTIRDGMAPRANHVHILPEGHRLAVDDNGLLHLTSGRRRKAKPTLIDAFFRDLASVCNRYAVGIVLSGNGNDGALGLKAIRSAGGLAMVQDAGNAEFDGMPRAAAEYASPDCLLDTADMVAPLCNHLRVALNNGKRAEQTQTDADDNTSSDEALAAALQILYEHTNYNFRHHKRKMLARRLHHRMTLNGAASTETYLNTLRDNAKERAQLCSDFLISVTDFFRNPESYAELDTTVIRKLLRERKADDPIRVWVPGCATGEEAYSIAMLLTEAIEASHRNHKFTIFATDVDEVALASARAGLYPDSIEADVSRERLDRFFDHLGTQYKIKSTLREQIVFARQSVTDDPPYSQIDLISCRNLLIYLRPAAQRHLVNLFHFALRESGYLFLGRSETVNETGLFEILSKPHRLYQRLTTDRRYRVDFPTYPEADDGPTLKHGTSSADHTARPREAELITRDILLAEHVPATVLVNREFEVLCSYGPTQDYLTLPLGRPSLRLLEMVRDDYRSHLRAITHRAFRDKEQHPPAVTLQDTDAQMVLMTARLLRRPPQARNLVMITFERVASTPDYAGEPASGREQALAGELEATRRELNGAISALEQSNEDLKSSNEEIMSMNEELQSTNEEMKTSKEELQSVNEELTTVNAELETKVADLESAHDDLKNLFSGTGVATLFLDRNLCIKRFTPAISEQFSLLSGDLGRPLSDMTLKFKDPDLLADATRVLDDLMPRQAEVQAAHDRWYKRSILPYRTRHDSIDGVVITFANITDLRNAKLAAQEHEARLDLAVSALSGGMWAMQLDPNAPDELPDDIYISPRLKRLLGFEDEQMASTLQAWTERILTPDRHRFSDAARRRQSNAGRPVHYRIRHRDGSIRWFASFGRVVTDGDGNSTRWIGIDYDITETKRADLRWRNVETQLRLLVDALPELIAFIDCDKSIRLTNAAFDDWYGLQGPIEHSAAAVLASAWPTLESHADKALSGTATTCSLELADHKGNRHAFQAHHIPHQVDHQIQGFYLLLSETATRTKWTLGSADEQARLIYVQRMAMVGEMASMLAHDLKQPLGAINNYSAALVRMLHADKPAEETTPIVQKIADQVERTNGIIEGVRGLVGRSGDGNSLIDINELLHRTVGLISARADKHDIDIRLSEHTPLPRVPGDRSQLQQVLVNLVNNAIDAMYDTPHGKRSIQLTSSTPDLTHVQVVVEDSGPGIPSGKLESVFESFVSTKLEGTGMGLAISRAIAHWHGGNLWAESQPGRGAKLFLSLPVDTDED